MVIAQLCPAAREVPQSLAWENGAVSWMLEIARGVDCPLLSVMVAGALVVPIAWLGKAYIVGETVTVPFETSVAVPESNKDSVPVGIVTATDPVFEPDVAGAKATETVQLALAASVAGQSFVSVNSAVAAMLLMVSGVAC